MPKAPTKADLQATFADLRKRADALKAAFTEPSMVAYVSEATEDLADAGQVLESKADAAAVVKTADFYLQYAAASVTQLEGVLKKFGSGAKTIA